VISKIIAGADGIGCFILQCQQTLAVKDMYVGIAPLGLTAYLQRKRSAPTSERQQIDLRRRQFDSGWALKTAANTSINNVGILVKTGPTSTRLPADIIFI